jgi:hypothetical protein
VKQIKYDFVLTRFGIRDDMNIDNLWHEFCTSWRLSYARHLRVNS